MTPDLDVRERESVGDATGGSDRSLPGEAARNRLLRRSDWRHLLPVAAPRRALCLAGGDLRASCATVAAAVDDEPRLGVLYDLVVADDPDEATLRSLVRVLAPDGACYVEARGPAPGLANRLLKRLQRAGFRGGRAYQPWPSPDDCRAWVPVQPPASGHFWRHATRATRVRRDRIRAAVAWSLARLGVHRHLGIVALAPAMPDAADVAASPAMVRLALGEGALHGSGGASGDGQALLLTPGERSIGKVVLLVLDASGAPVIALKTARVPEGAAGLLREADLLDAVHALHPAGMPGAPRVLFRSEQQGAPVIGETAHVGVPLSALIVRRSYPELAGRVTSWLSALAAPAADMPREPVWDRIIAPALARFGAEFAGVADATGLRRAGEILRTLEPLPVVCEQRDFSPWNVFEGAGGIIVLDWESGEPRGLPAMDLVYFLTHAAYYLEGAWSSGDFEGAYRAAWSGDTAIGRINHGCVATYLRRLGVREDAARALRLLCWILHSHSDYVHFLADSGASPTADTLRRSTFLRLYEAELREDAPC